MDIGLIIIGSELLTGKRRDGHMAHAIETLAMRGLDLAWTIYLGDAPARICAVLGDAMRMRGYFDMWPDLFYDFNQTDLTNDELARFVPSTVEIATIGDKLLAMPYGIAPTYVFAYVPLWEQDDIDDISSNGWTWPDYETIGLKIKAANPATTIYMTAYNMRLDDRLYRTMTSQKGEWFMDADLNVQVGNEISIQAMTWVKQFLDSDVVGHVDSGDYRSMMINGQIAAQIQGFFLSGQIKDVGQATSGDWMLLPLPSWEEGESSASITGGSYLYVNNLLKGHDKAADFVKWYTLNADAVVAGLDIGGIFPALLDAYETDYFDTEDAFFGGQKYLKDVAQNVHQAPAIFPSQFNAFNYDAFINAQESILFNQGDLVGMLTEARNAILANAAS